MSFQEKLRTLRKQQGMSQETLANELNVSRQAVSKWESGQSYPDMEKLIALSKRFETSIDSLVQDASPAEEKSSDSKTMIMRSHRLHYEYKSDRKLFGLPLIHVNIGSGLYVAKGIIAVGCVAIGLLSVGLLSLGVLCVGLLSLGLLSFGNLVLGVLLAVGGIAIGTLAIGGIAIGVFSLGGLSIGMFSIGGMAIASHVAIGEYAHGYVAVGRAVQGMETVVSSTQEGPMSDISAAEVQAAILKAYPHLWTPIIKGLTFIFH
ncbi:helix-turn-helix domain-containing protein [Sporolactobacillus sp. CPB3-1]|uniref:Helix-turn-helix domain-containing protein n=1 Tax=Sporolactobacillus mangiferae TaxID=2940498 RepID=A0ABT0MBJ3_9BACL|nr:helix-turn-helix transcriptional regulator [Sporolactobacillus mangiferae]MCL1631963.1 helix-turn-helix domain-containing protein [Sporolactobacillus mangiferae]